MVEGKVKFFNEKKGFGFIVTDNGDIFLHVSKITNNIIPKEGDLATFDIVNDKRGLQAHNVTIQ